MHRITSKRQTLSRNDIQFDGTLNVGYNLAYTYYTKFQLPFNGLNNDDIIQGFQPALMSLASTASSTDNYEEYSYYIHSDHLGSTSYITDSDGEVSQHVEYVPFGEVFIEELSSSAKMNTPFLFNGKELDEETGLYYYGARYYDPRISLWLSTDPLSERYPNQSSYIYCSSNPINRIELFGLTDFFCQENGEHKYIDDKQNQVVQITLKDYNMLVNNNFSSQSIRTAIDNGFIRDDLFFTIENVIEDKEYVPYGRFHNCFTCAVEQNNKQQTGPYNRIDLYNPKGNENFDDGIDYIISQLKEGNSLILGVKTGANPGNKNPNNGHFINIVGMGFDKNGNYFSYYDNAPSNRQKGTNLNQNRLYLNGKSLIDKTNIGVRGVKEYKATEVRRNK